MCFFTLCGARRYASARRGRGGPVRAALRRAMVQFYCATTYRGGARLAAYDTGCSISCSALSVRSYGRRLRALALLVVLLVSVPGIAHAEPSLEIGYNPTGLTGNDRGYVVVNCNNQYDAALEVLGIWATKIQLDSVKFAKLSNPETGGAFYTFAQSFFRMGSNGSDYHAYVGWAGDTYYQTLLVDVYGFGNVWAVETNKSAMDDAKRDYNVVLNGGSLGGGGSAQQEYVFTGGTPYSTASNNGFIENGVMSYYRGTSGKMTNDSVPKLSTSLEVHVPYSAAPRFFDTYATGEYDLWLNIVGSSSGSMSTCIIRATRFGQASIVSGTNSVYATNSYINTVTVSDSWWRSLTLSVGTHYVCSGGVFTIDSSVSNSGDGANAGAGSMVHGSGILLSGGVHQGPPLPPNNWPDDDTPTPDPPEVPGPGEPVDDPTPPDLPTPYEPVTDPDPPTYDPTPDPPANPVYDPNPTGTDYTPWLDYIIYLLKLINNNITLQFGNLDGWLTSHCNHIRQQIRDMTVWLGSKLVNAINNGFVSFERWLQGTFSPWFLDALEARLSAQLVELEGYLQELFEWLADELDFSVSGGGYDDSTVVSWLKKIYLQLYQLGNRSDSSTQVKLDTIDYGSSLSRVSAAYGELSDNLPFCVPADMQTVLGWVATSPVTPVFDVPWGFAGDSASVHVDLSGWDGVAAGCRSMFFAIFCLELCKYTLHLWRLYRAAFVGVSV